jgi:putative transposase
MNPSKYTVLEYINFLIATQKAYSCSEAERVQQITGAALADGVITGLLHRLEPDLNDFWQEAKDDWRKLN